MFSSERTRAEISATKRSRASASARPAVERARSSASAASPAMPCSTPSSSAVNARCFETVAATRPAVTRSSRRRGTNATLLAPVASTIRPLTIFDAAASKTVSGRMVEATGAKSVAFVPLLLDERVTAGLVAATVSKHRAFTAEELGVLQGIAGDAALALDRARSTAGLAEALARERFVALISARVRSELNIDELLRVAVEETGLALAVDRCLIRLGSHGEIPTAQ